MPHVTLEYTQNLRIAEPTKLLLAINAALWESGQFAQPQDIKSRAIALQSYAVGENVLQSAFVHVTLALRQGRSAETKRQLSERLLDVLRSAADWASQAMPVQLCVNIQELDASYAHTTVLPEA